MESSMEKSMLKVVRRWRWRIDIEVCGKPYTIGRYLDWYTRRQLPNNETWFGPAVANMAPSTSDGEEWSLFRMRDIALGLVVGSDWDGRSVRYRFK